jgi:hypothetical protein
MKRILSASAVVFALSGGAVFAQSETATMDVGLSMIELAVSKQFSQLGIDTDPMSLSLNQLATIKGVLESSEYNQNEKAAQVKAVIARN